MTFYRITKPLTALALCALLGTAWTFAPAITWAQDVVEVESMSAEEAENAQDTAIDVAAEAAADETTETTDDDMPPMATAETEILTPPDTSMIVPPYENRIVPNMGQMQSMDMNAVGRTNALPEKTPPAVQKPYVAPVGDTHPTLYLTPDKSEIVRLDSAASAVIVGNEAHVNVLIDTPTTLVAVPRQPGASYFTVLDSDRRVIMQRHVVVGPAAQYVRVRRSCSGSSNCEHTSTFYCPDGMCHPVTTRQVPGTPPAQNPAAFATMGGSSTMGTDNMDMPAEGEAPAAFPFPFPFIPVPFGMPGGDAEE
ncbi:MAG: pilus assembly protein N-terminal domain-containing protein [Alphaproteobacteria bacterium]|nr:pilus assembly protein N-terminal domain-containing protein [Alphaproteobacteria bacterium]